MGGFGVLYGSDKTKENMKTIKIFLASSAELDEDKKQFEIYINEKNIDLQNRGIFLELKTWKNFISSIKEGRTQDEYNEYIKGCDITIFLFHTKLGQYTKEEFDNAHDAFLKSKRRNKKPHVFTYFRKDENESEEITKFKDYIDGLDHFYDTYYNWDNLLVKFNHQLDKIIRSPIIRIIMYFVYFFLLPFLVLTGSFFSYYYFQSADMTVKVCEVSTYSIPRLPLKEGKVTIIYGDKTENKNYIEKEGFSPFTQIPSKYRGCPIKLHFEAKGFVSIDTSFTLSLFKDDSFILPIKRDHSLEIIFGIVKDEDNFPVKDVTLTVLDIKTKSDENGNFKFIIPMDKQAEYQKLIAFKPGYNLWSRTSPVIPNIETPVILRK